MISGYHAALNAAAVGLGFEVLVFVHLGHGDREQLAAFDQGLAAIPEVIQAERLFGTPDYLLRVVQIETDMARGQYIDPQAGRLTVRQHAERWLASLTMDPGTYVGTEQRIRLHVLPYPGSRTLASLRPTHIREWLRKLQDGGVASAYQRVIFANLSTMLTAAVDDRHILEKPCCSSSVRAPKLDPRRIVPWPRERALAIRSALPEQYRAMVDLAGGCGLRQGEVLGLAVEDMDFIEGVVHVVRQVKFIRNRPVHAPPKGARTRTVPLPESVARSRSTSASTRPPL